MTAKIELDQATAWELGIDPKVVRKVTTQYLREIRRALIEDGEVNLTGLGRLVVVEYTADSNLGERLAKGSRSKKVPLKHRRVYFHKARALRDALKENRR